MKAAIVSPSEYLSTIQPFSTYHLILTHMVLHSPAYQKFYRERSDAGDYIILDNGAVEKKGCSVPMRDIATAAILTRPSVVVLPDFLFDGERTIQELSTAIKSPQFKWLYRACPNIKISAVVQGLDEEEWLESFHILNGLEGIDVLGIPKVTGHTFGARWKALDRIAKYVKKPCHLLGFWHESNLEDLQHEASYSFAMGVDTPKPIRLAAAGKTLKEWNFPQHDRSFLERRHNGSMDLGLLKANCQEFVELCHGNQ